MGDPIKNLFRLASLLKKGYKKIRVWVLRSTCLTFIVMKISLNFFVIIQRRISFSIKPSY
ncbi:hypothetical protein RhiirA4_492012 [Rhizophagus irregularis]|uniref:Uncharacterized protein n=1 Tax=Rhizophagus irregularis TaxID=588596 RepID=A0A2I1HWY7_9GLOM|nr:hypothetical protein RhiirA4_492012 [Rhizophagus irregularis]